MKKYEIIIHIFLLIIIIGIAIHILNYFLNNMREGFNGHSTSTSAYKKMMNPNESYGECIKMGYTKEFCLQTPAFSSPYGLQTCQCKEGQLGVILPGFRGRCMCSPMFTIPYT